jgi:hypothetical protein
VIVVASDNAAFEIGFDLSLDVAVGSLGDWNAARKLSGLFKYFALIVAERDTPISELLGRYNSSCCHFCSSRLLGSIPPRWREFSQKWGGQSSP